jgi:DNA (cytosine-5)-methyltransferase 1
MREMTAIDLFSGCGGLSYGFEQAGYKILLGVDSNAPALQTFEANHPHSQGINLDLSENIKNLLKYVKKGQVDVIIGGPPCQGFSLTGPRNFEDKRNKLYLAVFNAVQLFKPLSFVIENVLQNDPQATVQVRLEINAEFPNGVSDQTKRAVSENANQLGFTNKTWE